MSVSRAVFLAAGLFGALLFVLSLVSIAFGGNLPLLGNYMGGTFLLVVSLVIAAGSLLLFFRRG